MEGFDISKSLYNAYAPINNDASKWQRIYDMKLQWQMENEKNKNNLKLLRTSSATEQMKALSNLNFNIIPGADQEYAQSVLQPIKEAVNEIYGGLMSGQDTEYYLDQSGKVFSYVQNLLNSDKRLTNAISNSSVIQSTIGSMNKQLEDQKRYDPTALSKYRDHVNKIDALYRDGKIDISKYNALLRTFDDRKVLNISSYIDQAKNMKVDFTKVQDGELEKIKENPDLDKVYSLLHATSRYLGGNLTNIIRYKDKDNNVITVQDFNAIKDPNEKKKYKQYLVMNSLECGDDDICATVIGEVASSLPGIKSEQNFNKQFDFNREIEKLKLQYDQDIAKKLLDHKNELDKIQLKSLYDLATANVKSLTDSLKSYTGEEANAIQAKINYWNDYARKLREGSEVSNIADAGTTQTKEITDEKLSNTNVDTNDGDIGFRALTESRNSILNQTIGKDVNKEGIATALVNMFARLDNGANKELSVMDNEGNVSISAEANKYINYLVKNYMKEEDIKMFKDKGYTYKQIFDHLYNASGSEGFLRNVGEGIVNVFSKMKWLKPTEIWHKLGSNPASGSLTDTNKAIKKVYEDVNKETKLTSQKVTANPNAQNDITGYIKGVNYTTFSADGKEVNKDDINKVTGLNYVGDNIYVVAEVLDKETGKYVEKNLHIDTDSGDVIVDEIRNKMMAYDSNNSFSKPRNGRYDIPVSRAFFNAAGNRVISTLQNTVRFFQRFNSLDDKTRRSVDLKNHNPETGDYKTYHFMDYTGGAFAIEIYYSIDKDNNSFDDLVEVKPYKDIVDKNGKKVRHYYSEPFVIDISRSGNHMDNILANVYKFVSDIDNSN